MSMEGLRVTVLQQNGRARTITLTAHPVEASPLYPSRPIPSGAAFFPASIEDAKAMIAYCEKVIEYMKPPKKGKKSTDNNRNTGLM